MKIKIQKRQTGKTTDIISRAVQEEDAIVIVMHPQAKSDMLKVEALKDRVFTMHEVINNKMLVGRKYGNVYIDEVGACLDAIIPHIKYGTHTNEGD